MILSDGLNGIDVTIVDNDVYGERFLRGGDRVSSIPVQRETSGMNDDVIMMESDVHCI